MKHSNISIFVPHVGCPCSCSFCNQKRITGQVTQPQKKDIVKAVETAVLYNKNMENTELAFFGGSFTAIEKNYRTRLLTVGKELVEKFDLKGIRISTRPDCIDEEILQELKTYKVTAIELGAQSMNDEVLRLNDRGHNKKSIVKASKLIKNMGFELGLQMMTGLYGSTSEDDFQTAKEILALQPDTLRLYPTIVFKDTKLCDLYMQNLYKPQSLEEAIEVCSKIIPLCTKTRLIRIGLHDSDELKNAVAGPYHPAFRELCESRIFYQKILEKLQNVNSKDIIIYVNQKDISKVIGQKRENLNKLRNLFINANVKISENLKQGQIELKDVLK